MNPLAYLEPFVKNIASPPKSYSGILAFDINVRAPYPLLEPDLRWGVRDFH